MIVVVGGVHGLALAKQSGQSNHFLLDLSIRCGSMGGMNTKMKAALEQAIDDVIQNHAEEDMWDGYIHNELHIQMANAAEQVFDAAQTVQVFAKQF